MLPQSFLEHSAVKGGVKSYQGGFPDKVEPGQEGSLRLPAGALLSGAKAM